MDYVLTKWCIQKSLAFLYAIAFLIAINQYRALVGNKGIAPMENWARAARFWQEPSLFIFCRSDRFIQALSWLGFLLSLLTLVGVFDRLSFIVYAAAWFALWILYLSFVNAGGVFYGFGWEILLLEAGFLAIFLGPAQMEPSVILIWLYRWLLFRVMLGAGLIKIRCDSCWRDLTSLLFHYETQPLPGPLSRFFHRLPVFVHKTAVLSNHFIELVVPFFFFGPAMIAAIGGILTFLFQFMLVISGNFSWLNFITMALCFSCFNDAVLAHIVPFVQTGSVFAANAPYQILTVLLALLIAYLSIKPIRNLFSRCQAMNCSYDPFHLVNTYGAFGTVTRVRNEIILEGTSDTELSDKTVWLPYEFKGKPGDVKRWPRQVSPYHYKIDWQMWFAAMSSPSYNPWFFSFVQKILEGDRAVLSLLRVNPFPDVPPKFIRAELYEYHFAPKGTQDESFWVRKKVGVYLLPSHLRKI